MTFTQNRLVRYFWFTLMELCLDETPSFIFIYLFIFNCCIECCASFITELLIKCSLLESCSADKGQVYLKVNENTELDWIFFLLDIFSSQVKKLTCFPTGLNPCVLSNAFYMWVSQYFLNVNTITSTAPFVFVSSLKRQVLLWWLNFLQLKK